MMKKVLIIFVIFVFNLFGKIENKGLLKINDKIITTYDLNISYVLDKMSKGNIPALSELDKVDMFKQLKLNLDYYLVFEELEKLKITQPEIAEECTQAWNKLVLAFDSIEKLRFGLLNLNIDTVDLKKAFFNTAAVNRYLEKRIQSHVSVSDDEILYFIEKSKIKAKDITNDDRKKIIKEIKKQKSMQRYKEYISYLNRKAKITILR
ncbi:MAG: hypothetical protein ABIA04_14405 [Pseudomonadota bacterium]